MLSVVQLPGVVEPDLHQRVWFVILAGSGALVVGSIVGYAIRTDRVSKFARLDIDAVTRGHVILCVMYAVSLALSIYQLLPVIERAGGFSAVFGASNFGGAEGNAYRVMQIESAEQALISRASGVSGLMLGAANYIMFLGSLSFVSSGALWIYGRRMLAAAPLLLAAAYSLVSLQRTTFVVALLIAAGSAVLHIHAGSRPKASRNRPRSFGKGIVSLIALVVLAAVLLIPSALRASGTSQQSGLQSLFAYFVSGIAGLNTQFDDSGRSFYGLLDARSNLAARPELGLGSYTFKGAAGILNRLGVDLQIAPHNFEFWDVNILGITTATNVGSIYLALLLDWRLYGAALFMFAVGVVFGLVHGKVRSGSITSIPFLAILSASLAWSFFVPAIFSDARFLILMMLGGLIYRAMASPKSIPVTNSSPSFTGRAAAGGR